MRDEKEKERKIFYLAYVWEAGGTIQKSKFILVGRGFGSIKIGLVLSVKQTKQLHSSRG